jgi:hydrogenase maturation protease
MHNIHSGTITLPVALVVCIGNELVADDAAGYAVYEKLRSQKVLPNVRIEYCGVGGVALLDLLTGDEELMIVVDAVIFGALPGTVHRIAWQDLPQTTGAAVSAHGIGLKETIQIGTELFSDKMPREVVLIGIEGACFDLVGVLLTSEVAAGIDNAVICIQRELSGLTAGRIV